MTPSLDRAIARAAKLEESPEFAALWAQSHDKLLRVLLGAVLNAEDAVEAMKEKGRVEPGMFGPEYLNVQSADLARGMEIVHADLRQMVAVVKAWVEKKGEER
jgi:hypothetical protein